MEAVEEPSPFLGKKQKSQEKSKTSSHKKSTELDMKRKKSSKNSTDKSSQSKLKLKVQKTLQEKNKEQDSEPSLYTDFQSKQNSKCDETSVVIHKTDSANAILIADEEKFC